MKKYIYLIIKKFWFIVLIIVGFCILNFDSLEGKKKMEKFINNYWWIILIITVIFYSSVLDGIGDKKHIFKIGPYYIYFYKKKEDYDKFLEIINVFEKYNIMPKVVFNKGLIVVVEDVGVSLSDYNLNHNTLKGFQQKINFIRDTFQKHNFVHHDLHLGNIIIKNENIYIIDIDGSFFEENYQINHNGGCCYILPKAKNDNIVNYINDNPCIKGLWKGRWDGKRGQMKEIYGYIKKITLILCILVILRVKKII